MRLRKITTFILLIFSACFSIFSQKRLEGYTLSSSVEKTLLKNNFTPIQQTISATGQDNFAYNILLEFTETESRDKTNTLLKENLTDIPKSADSKKSENRRNQVIFCFTQEDFYLNEEEITNFLNVLKDMKRSWTALILFSALDKCEYIKQSINEPENGTEVFANSVFDTDTCCAIAVNLDSQVQTGIYTGSNKCTSPLWLTKQISDAFYSAKTDFAFENVLSVIYRLGIVKGQKRLGTLFRHNIPAIEINFSQASQLNVLQNFAKAYSPEDSSEWDMHYIYISRGILFKALFVNEKTILITCLAVGIFTILLLCIFSFIGENGERHKYEFIKSSYMIPFSIALSFLSLIVGQKLVSIISAHFYINPIFQYGIKIIISMLFFSLIFLLQGIFKFSVTAFMYGYLLLVVAIFNIFLFSTRDLTLFVIFAGEYILIYMSRSVKRLSALIFFFILMLLPFIPYGYIIISRAEEAELTKTVFTSAGGNLLLSLAIFPFQITWLRMLVLINVRAGIKGWTMKRIALNAALSTIQILAFIFMLLLLISHYIYRPAYRKSQKIETIIQRNEKFTLSAKLSKDTFSGMNTNHIKIQSEENALRYEVKLRGIETAHPVYDSIYNYTMISDSDGDYYSFIIPDYPPRKITIDYAASAMAKAEIEITAYYRTDIANVYRCEKRNLRVE